VTPTQRLTREAFGAAFVPRGELVTVAFALGAGVRVGVRVGVGLADEALRGVAVDLGVVTADVGVLVACGAFIALTVFAVFGAVDAVAAELEVSVRVGSGVAPDRVVADGAARGEDGPALVVVGVGVGVVVVGVGVGSVGAGSVGAGSVGVGVESAGVGVGGVEVVLGVAAVAGVEACVVDGGSGVVGVAVEPCELVALDACELGVGVGDGLGEAAGNCSGSHDWPLDVVAALAAVLLAAMARLAPEAAVSRTLPAISVTVAGRACAKRIKRPTSAARYYCGTTHLVRSGFIRGSSARRGMPPIGHQAPSRALPLPAPQTGPVTVLSVIRDGRSFAPL
jgi:hypothetical protein